MKQHQILKIISTLGIIFWFVAVIAIAIAVGLFVYSDKLRSECGADLISSLQLFYDPN